MDVAEERVDRSRAVARHEVELEAADLPLAAARLLRVRVALLLDRDVREVHEAVFEVLRAERRVVPAADKEQRK